MTNKKSGWMHIKDWQIKKHNKNWYHWYSTTLSGVMLHVAEMKLTPNAGKQTFVYLYEKESYVASIWLDNAEDVKTIRELIKQKVD